LNGLQILSKFSGSLLRQQYSDTSNRSQCVEFDPHKLGIEVLHAELLDVEVLDVEVLDVEILDIEVYTRE